MAKRWPNTKICFDHFDSIKTGYFKEFNHVKY